MTSNFNEFIGMLLLVSASTFLIVGFRWAILRIGNQANTSKNTGVAQR
tara:strand:+ start:5922 stop:6065 length:144 start_codon:yes stop_codon:yes gene_type:complete